MSTQRDQQPLVIDRIRLRWWGWMLLPLIAGFALASQGWLPVGLLMVLVFGTVFWIISLSVALVILLMNRPKKEPRQ